MNTTGVMSVDGQGNVEFMDHGWPASEERLARKPDSAKVGSTGVRNIAAHEQTAIQR
jgi:hypothetical protein